MHSRTIADRPWTQRYPDVDYPNKEVSISKFSWKSRTTSLPIAERVEKCVVVLISISIDTIKTLILKEPILSWKYAILIVDVPTREKFLNYSPYSLSTSQSSLLVLTHWMKWWTLYSFEFNVLFSEFISKYCGLRLFSTKLFCTQFRIYKELLL